jgi:hypothetical protein
MIAAHDDEHDALTQNFDHFVDLCGLLPPTLRRGNGGRGEEDND